MALDTQNKRLACIGVGTGMMLPVPTGSAMDAGDREQMAGMFRFDTTTPGTYVPRGNRLGLGLGLGLSIGHTQ